MTSIRIDCSRGIHTGRRTRMPIPFRALLITLLLMTQLAHGHGWSARPSSVSASESGHLPPDAEFLSIEHVYELMPDGGTRYTYSHSLRMLSNFGFTRQYGESFIVYDPRVQQLKVTRSVTRMRDGREVASPFNAYNEVLPSFAHNDAAYAHLREMVVTHTGLEIGSTTEYSYTVTSAAGAWPGLSARVMLGARSPIRVMTVRVRVPASVTLSHAAAGVTAQPEARIDGSVREYLWRFADLAPLPVESHQPPMDLVLPMLFFTTSSFDALSSHAVGASGVYELDASAAALAAETVKPHATPLARAQALRSLVEMTTGLMSGDPMVHGYRARPAKDVFASASGSQLDRAVLLAALCRSVGLKAVPVLVTPYVSADGGGWSAGGALPRSLPCAHLFTGAAVRVEGVGPDGAAVVLDPNETQPGYSTSKLARGSMLRLERGVSAIEALPLHGAVRKTDVVADLSLAPGFTLSGGLAAEISGPAGFELDPSALFSRMKSQVLPSAAGITVTRVIADAPNGTGARCEVKVERTTPFPVIGGLMTLPIPSAMGLTGEGRLLLPNTGRSTPVWIGMPIDERTRMTVHLPAGVRPDPTPVDIKVENAIGSVRIRIIPGPDDVEVDKQLRVTRPIIPVESYEMLRQLLEAWTLPAHQQIRLLTAVK